MIVKESRTQAGNLQQLTLIAETTFESQILEILEDVFQTQWYQRKYKLKKEPPKL